MGTEASTDTKESTMRYCGCGRQLRDGERCSEHLPRSGASIIAETWARHDEAVAEANDV